jgi:hypothetical protein
MNWFRGSNDSSSRALLPRLREHFGAAPDRFPIVSQRFEASEHPNLQCGIDTYLAAEGRSATLLGLVTPRVFRDVRLAELIAPRRNNSVSDSEPTEGPVEYVNVGLADDQVIPCVNVGLYLIRNGPQRVAILLSGPDDSRPLHKSISVEVMAPQREIADRFLADIRDNMRVRNVYRGNVLSLAPASSWGDEVVINFHRLPAVQRDQIILPAGLLERIEQQTLEFSRYGEKLRAAGRHLRRGILFYGPPGTGKTLTTMYLVRQMPERTTILLTGRSLGLIGRSCALARMLEPSIVVIEDVDLVAEDRHQPGRGGATPVLFDLLNAMDGLADDCNVLFLLTTNRPQVLEPALAARPGRVDQAVELPLPDEAGRQRLFELYARGLAVHGDPFSDLAHRTEGISGAFIRELMRRATLRAVRAGGNPEVDAQHLNDAFHELAVDGGEFTRSFLGFRPS